MDKRHTYKAFKVWHDTPHYIHQDSSKEVGVKWTTDEAEAKICPTWREASDFFFDGLGFSINGSLPGSLKLSYITEY